MTIRPAARGDLDLLHPLIERAYRGDSARRGWTHEADLVEGERIDRDALAAIVDDPAARLLIALDGATAIGSVHVADRGDGLAYLGLLAVDPPRQAGGVGRLLIEAAETLARDGYRARSIEMTVIDRRPELIAYYARRGYRPSGETRDFPIALDPPLSLTVLVKPLV